MKNISANIAFYGCFVIALIVTNSAMSYAAELAYAGKQPVIWVSVLAFFAVIGLVLLAIYIKGKFKI